MCVLTCTAVGGEIAQSDLQHPNPMTHHSQNVIGVFMHLLMGSHTPEPP